MKLSLAMFEICSWSDPCRSAIGPGERGVWRVDSLVCYLPSRVLQPGEVTRGSMWREAAERGAQARRAGEACGERRAERGVRREAYGERRAGEARMHLTRREVCASASHRPLTDRHGRPSSVWACSQQPSVPAPRRHRGGALCRRPEARAAAFHRLRVLGSSRILRNSGPRSLVAWSGSSPEGVLERTGLRGWGGGGGIGDLGPGNWARQAALGAQIGEGAPLGPRGAALRQRVAAWSSLGAVGVGFGSGLGLGLGLGLASGLGLGSGSGRVGWLVRARASRARPACACGVTCDAVDRGGVHDREVRLLVARALVRVRARVRVRVRAS